MVKLCNEIGHKLELRPIYGSCIDLGVRELPDKLTGNTSRIVHHYDNLLMWWWIGERHPELHVSDILAKTVLMTHSRIPMESYGCGWDARY